MNWFRKMLYGRYGSDRLGRAILYLCLAGLVLGLLTGWALFDLAVMALLVLSYLRMFSKNISARRTENETFLRIWTPYQQRLTGWVSELGDRKSHLYCRCPACAQKIRVPRGRGRINISCPKCGQAFVKKT